jgi:hypothetical protein
LFFDTYTVPLKKVPGTRTFIISDRNERREIKEAMTTLARDIKTLQATKKQKADQVDASLKLIKAAKENEQAIRVSNGTTFKEVIAKVEDIFQKYNITKPYYHGGKYSGKGMCKFMTASSQIMDYIRNMIFDIPQEQRCSNEEVL